MTARIQDHGAALMTAAIGSTFFLQWGVGSNAPSSANTVTGSGSEPRALPSVTVVGNVMTISGKILAIADVARSLSEVGVFDGPGAGVPPSGGNMIFYADFAPIAISLTGQGIQFNFTITLPH